VPFGSFFSERSNDIFVGESSSAMPAARGRSCGQEWTPGFQPWMKSRVRRALNEQWESRNIVQNVLDAARPRKGPEATFAHDLRQTNFFQPDVLTPGDF